MTDVELVRAAQDGDVTAFAVLVEEHRAALRATAIGVLGHVTEVDDAVQDAVLIALGQLPQLRDPAAVGPWLRSVVRTSCLMLLRSRRATPVGDPEPLMPPDVGRGPADLLDRAATRDWVQTAVAALPEPVREVTVLRHFSGQSSYQQIAQLCGIPVDTVRSRLRTGRRALESALRRAASGAHVDARAASAASWDAAEDLLDAALREDFGRVLAERFHPDATVDVGGRLSGDRSTLVHSRDFTQGAGVGVRLVRATASRDLMVWETDFVNPADDPDHCPPSMAWLHTVREGRISRLRLAYGREATA